MYQGSADSLHDALDRAETRRRDVLSSRTVDAWRWINGAGDNAPPGLTIDCYRHDGTQTWLVAGAREHSIVTESRAPSSRGSVGSARGRGVAEEIGSSRPREKIAEDVAVSRARESRGTADEIAGSRSRESRGVAEEVVRAWALAAAERISARGVVLKRLSRSVRESTSEVIFGEVPPAPVRVREDDAVFLCDLDDGISTGLFLDQREARRRSRDFASGREVLNLFAYTCAFSVHAALAEARRVTSVDVSKKALRRGRENMSASGLDPDRHRWFDDDVFVFLTRQRKKAPAFDLVIADPPVFGRARGATFALERELPVLLAGCIAATAPAGVVVFSTHLLSVEEDGLVAIAREAAAGVSRSIVVIETMGLPEWDHPAASVVDDRGNYLKTLVLRVE